MTVTYRTVELVKQCVQYSGVIVLYTTIHSATMQYAMQMDAVQISPHIAIALHTNILSTVY